MNNDFEINETTGLWTGIAHVVVVSPATSLMGGRGVIAPV